MFISQNISMFLYIILLLRYSQDADKRDLCMVHLSFFERRH